MDPQFASLDPGCPAFLRPTVPAAQNGYGGTYIGARPPLDITPLVVISEANLTVSNEVTWRTISGTSQWCVGGMNYQSATGNVLSAAGDFAAAASWSVNVTNLLVGINAVTVAGTNQFGEYYEIRGMLRGPNGVALHVKTIWMREHLSEATRFITLLPDKPKTL